MWVCLMLQIRMWSEGRNWFKYLAIEAGFRVLFLESVCNDEELIRKNCEMKLNSPGELSEVRVTV